MQNQTDSVNPAATPSSDKVDNGASNPVDRDRTLSPSPSPCNNEYSQASNQAAQPAPTSTMTNGPLTPPTPPEPEETIDPLIERLPFDYHALHQHRQQQDHAIEEQFVAIQDTLIQMIDKYICLNQAVLMSRMNASAAEVNEKYVEIKHTEDQQAAPPNLTTTEIARQKLVGFIDAVKKQFSAFVGGN
ncbi:hypothetical protein HDV00_011650 [Rhizophlyctis rosea]|nr:hypothetical protein HDV00_011650 [Rhizophlyctis rosea]